MRDIELTKGGGVPGGHWCIKDGDKKPFITPMRECNSIELRYDDIVVDIGAYVGTYSIRCARFPVKKVIAYEPTPETFEILNLTRLYNLININAAVCGDSREKAKIYLSKGIGVTNSLIPSKAKPAFVEVDSVKYSDAIKEATIVKIDIEGGEYDIPLDDFVHDNLRAIIIDFHPVGKDWVTKAENIVAEIESEGFSPVIKPDWGNGWTRAGSWKREMTNIGPGNYCLLNGIYCCGCGALIKDPRGRKTICIDCYGLWSKKHSRDFDVLPRYIERPRKEL